MLLGSRIGRSTYLATIFVALAAILFAKNIQDVWDDSVLRDMAQSYRQQVFQLKEKPYRAETVTLPLDGIVILVTGSTSGIGRSLVRWAFREGATIVAMGRSLPKLELLQNGLVEENKALQGRFFPIVADMSDLVSVSSSVDDIRTALSSAAIHQIDIVVCNAGIFQSSDQAASFPTSKQGYELTFGVNYLSHFLLAEKLMRTRIASGDEDESDGLLLEQPGFILSPKTSRVVQVSSSYHMGVDGTALSVVTNKHSNASNHAPPASQISTYYSSGREGPALGFLKYYFRSQREYATSKLAQLLQTRISNRKFFSFVENQQIHSKNRVYVPFVSACPGWVGTKILRHKIEKESMLERFFDAVSFDVDGYGLSSILKAMFDPLLLNLDSHENGDNKEYDESLDYFPNFGGLAAWVARVGEGAVALMESICIKVLGTLYFESTIHFTRDILSQLGAGLTILIQPFFKTTDVSSVRKKHPGKVAPELFRYWSSTPSYDRTLQEGLYEWSIQTVAEYM